MKSIDFWNQRYRTDLSSGEGSRGHLLKFKVDFINDFVEKNKVCSVLDFGHGDLFVARQLKVDDYAGIDIFTAPLGSNLKLLNCRFDEYQGQVADLVICLDVLYHILEEEQDYMKKSLDNMIRKTNKHLIIYAQDSLNTEFFDREYKGHLYNSRWLQYLQTKNEIKLVYRQQNPEAGYTSAQFFVFEKTG